MQSVLSRNWTRIAVSISCDDNHYTTGTRVLNMMVNAHTRTYRINSYRSLGNGTNRFCYHYPWEWFSVWKQFVISLHTLNIEIKNQEKALKSGGGDIGAPLSFFYQRNKPWDGHIDLKLIALYKRKTGIYIYIYIYKGLWFLLVHFVS